MVRAPVVPREIATAVTVAAIARAAWATGILILLLALPGVVSLLERAGRPDVLWQPVGAVLVMVAAIVVMARRPSTATLVGYIVVGSACLWVYQMAMLRVDPSLQHLAQYAINRPALALVLVGTASVSPISAVWWALGGFAAAQATMLLVTVQLGLPPVTGVGAPLAFANYAAAFVAIALIHRTQRDHVPDVDRLREEARRLELRRAQDRRAAALIHDTILNDLALIATAPDQLDARMRTRLLADLDTLSQPDAAGAPLPRSPQGQGAAPFRDELLAIASDFRWRGLNVDVAIDPSAPLALSAEAAAAALGAVRTCLENVVLHAGVDSADLILGGEAGQVTLMVVDAGVGFDWDAVPADRLGLRSSLVHRVESAGGSVRLWSAVGSGTSVLISLPALDSPRTEREAADA